MARKRTLPVEDQAELFDMPSVETTEPIIPEELPVEEQPRLMDLPYVDVSLRWLYVMRGYRGHATQEQVIAPGVYREDDPALFGVAPYLLETSHAVVVREGFEPPQGAD